MLYHILLSYFSFVCPDTFKIVFFLLFSDLKGHEVNGQPMF